jgi:hypothetical protein
MDSTISRRALLAGAGLAIGYAASGVGRRWGILGGLPFEELDHATCLERLYASLSPGQRSLCCFDWDHPSRQLTNTVPIFHRPHVGTLLGAEQRDLVARLYATMLSDVGHPLFRSTLSLEAGGIDGCMLAIYGQPGGPMQASINGGHLHVRSPGSRASGAALGGPIAYGQQTGNGTYRVQGNAFAFQSERVNELYQQLPSVLQAQVRVPRFDAEFIVQIQDETGSFPGVRFGSMPDAARERAHALVRTVLSSYPGEEREEALSCIEHNGGLDALHLAVSDEHGYYPDRSTVAKRGNAEPQDGIPPFFQVWRVEGPGTVLRFQGAPHVHAYLHVVRDVHRPSVGETLAWTEAPVEGAALQRLARNALVHSTVADHAYYPWPAATRLRAGAVTTGDLWSLDPFDNHVGVAFLRGDAMGPELRDALRREGVEVEPRREYRIAATRELLAGGELAGFGEPRRVEDTGISLRDALVREVRQRGLAA